MVDGGRELAEKIFDMPVRVANPLRITGKTEVIDNPVFATAVGLLHSGLGQEVKNQASFYGGQKGIKGAWGKMKEWFQVNF